MQSSDYFSQSFIGILLDKYWNLKGKSCQLYFVSSGL